MCGFFIKTFFFKAKHHLETGRNTQGGACITQTVDDSGLSKNITGFKILLIPSATDYLTVSVRFVPSSSHTPLALLSKSSREATDARKWNMRFNSVTEGPPDTDHLHAREPKTCLSCKHWQSCAWVTLPCWKWKYLLCWLAMCSLTPPNQHHSAPPADAGGTSCCAVSVRHKHRVLWESLVGDTVRLEWAKKVKLRLSFSWQNKTAAYCFIKHYVVFIFWNIRKIATLLQWTD